MGWLDQLLGWWLWACLVIVAAWIAVFLLVRFLIRTGPDTEGDHDGHVTTPAPRWWSGLGRKLGAWRLHRVPGHTTHHDSAPAAGSDAAGLAGAGPRHRGEDGQGSPGHR